MNVEKIDPPRKIPAMRHAGIYCRVSTSNYDQISSLGNQIDGLIEYVLRQPLLHLTDIYIDICSGHREKERENLKRLMNDCNEGRIDYIIVKSVSRFSRDTNELLNVVRKCRKMHVTVYFQNENISSDNPGSELYLSMFGAVAQAESDGKSENIKWGIKRAKKDPNSKYNNRKFYGYDHDGEGKLVVNEEQAAVVREIYSLYLNGKSVLKIIDQLKEEGILSPRGNAVWPKHSIEVILSDERYTGKLTAFQKERLEHQTEDYQTEDHHPPIIDHEVFEAVIKLRDERSNLTMNENGEIVRKKTRYKSK